MYLEQTCIAAPEQYDVFDNDYHYQGYIRLRNGHLTYQDTFNNILFSKRFSKDPYKCCFDNDFEKYDYLFLILEEINSALPIGYKDYI